MNKLTDASQTWEQLLYTSGGKLEISKCAIFVLQWEFTPEEQHFLIETPTTDPVKIVSSETSEKFLVPQVKSTYSFKYLGIKSTLTGSQQPQLIDTTTHATNGARLISASPFTRLHSKLYLLTHLMPKITYPLSCASFSASQYSRLHKRFTPTAISALGYNRYCPLALRYGKLPYGGLQLKNCEVEALILKIKGLKNYCVR